MTRGRCRIVGLGNPYAGDDAVGLRVAEALRAEAPPECDVELCETPSWELFADAGAGEILIFVDGIRSGRPPGTIHELTLDDVMGAGLRHCSSHGLGLIHWGSLAEALGENTARVLIFAVEIERTEMGAELSPAVAAALPALLDAIRRRLAREGGG